MNRYKTCFERNNYGFEPPLVQTADVVFDTDIPFDDENLDKFTNAAWDAMWEQNPHWKNPAPPVSGATGWSSVTGGRKYEHLAPVYDAAGETIIGYMPSTWSPL